MSSDALYAPVTVTAIGRSPATQISISDARFHEVGLEDNAGQVVVPLQPGMYKVTFREGDAVDEKMAVVLPGSGPVIVTQSSDIHFRSAVPIADTSTSHEWHQAHARQLSSGPRDVSSGAGAGLLLFVRDIGEAVVEERRAPAEGLPGDLQRRLELAEPVPRRWLKLSELGEFDPTVGLSLHDEGAKQLRDVPLITSLARVGGLRTDFAPGTYRLRLDIGRSQELEMPIVCVHGWRLNVFLLCREYGRERLRRADFDSASMSLSRTEEAFDPDAPGLRQTELALQALAQSQRLRGRALDAILRAKFDDPMLGLYGGHLLFLAPEPDHELIDTVIRNTGNLLGLDHPDVDALRVRRALVDRELPSPRPRFRRPPMLAAGWDAVVAGSRLDPELVPAGSLSDRVADRIARRGPWLVWTRPPDHVPVNVGPSDHLIVRLRDALFAPWLQKWVNDAPQLSASERTLAVAIHPAVDPVVRRLGAPDGGVPTEIALSERLNLPVNTVRRLLISLDDTLHLA